jgi:hypothetical protein
VALTSSFFQSLLAIATSLHASAEATAMPIVGQSLWVVALFLGLMAVYFGNQVNERGTRLLALRAEFEQLPLENAHATTLKTLSESAAKKWKVSFGLIDERRGFPVVVSPAREQPFTLGDVEEFLTAEKLLVRQLMLNFGAVLLRGFPISTPQAFEVRGIGFYGCE